MVRIVLVEDHSLQLEGLALLLKAFPDLCITAAFNHPVDFINKIDGLDFDIVLLDLHMPGLSGIAVAEKLKEKKHKSKIILLTMQRGVRFMQKAEKAGVDGYILKNIGVDLLHDIILKIIKGEKYFDESLRDYKQEDDIQLKSTITVSDIPNEILSEREKEILILVCKEYSSSQIAEKLFISVGTVDTHRKNILLKLGVNNTVGLVKYALKNKLLD